MSYIRAHCPHYRSLFAPPLSLGGQKKFKTKRVREFLRVLRSPPRPGSTGQRTSHFLFQFDIPRGMYVCSRTATRNTQHATRTMHHTHTPRTTPHTVHTHHLRAQNACSTPRTMHHAPRTLHHAPRTTHHAPRTTHHAPRTTHHAPRTTHHTPHTTHHTPHTTHYAPRTMHHLRAQHVIVIIRVHVV
jgi:hypothetical protein